jgi:hypothetical protein
MAKRRYLTKSRFKLPTECPTKLFYTGKREYANQNLDDSFLLALADGGYFRPVARRSENLPPRGRPSASTPPTHGMLLAGGCIGAG